MVRTQELGALTCQETLVTSNGPEPSEVVASQQTLWTMESFIILWEKKFQCTTKAGTTQAINHMDFVMDFT